MSELELLSENFTDWKAALELKDNITLEESLALFKSFGLSIPRLIMPGANYPLRFYRARVIRSDSSEDLSDPKTFSYPPARYCETFQRANAPGYPVFYGALDGKTAFEELRINGSDEVKKGDMIYLSEWRTKPGAIYNMSYLTQPGITDESQLFSPITKNVFKQFPRIFQNEDPVFTQTQRFLYEELGNLFLTGKHIQTGILAYEILYNTPQFAGLTINGLGYPSCANNYRSVNFALHPDFVDAQLELVSVRKMAFEEFTEDAAHTKVSYFADVVKGKVKWQTYVSELLIHHYDLELLLAFEWPMEDVKSGQLVINGHETDLRKYCDAIVNSIDPTQHQLPAEGDELFKKNSQLLMVYDHQFVEGEAMLKISDNVNPISMLRIKTPVKTYTRKVGWKKVLKSH